MVNSVCNFLIARRHTVIRTSRFESRFYHLPAPGLFSPLGLSFTRFKVRTRSPASRVTARMK